MNWYIKVLKQYTDFKGRARRKEFWMFFIFNLIISYSIVFLNLVFEIPELTLLSTLFTFGILIPSIAVTVRRLHDVGKSGWFILIPLYNLFLVCSAGNKGDNVYGVDPKLPKS